MIPQHCRTTSGFVISHPSIYSLLDCYRNLWKFTWIGSIKKERKVDRFNRKERVTCVHARSHFFYPNIQKCAHPSYPLKLKSYILYTHPLFCLLAQKFAHAEGLWLSMIDSRIYVCKSWNCVGFFPDKEKGLLFCWPSAQNSTWNCVFHLIKIVSCEYHSWTGSSSAPWHTLPLLLLCPRRISSLFYLHLAQCSRLGF